MTYDADPISAVVALLLGRAAITAEVGDDVYGEELPASLAEAMPKAAIACQSAGGIGAGDSSYLPIGGQRIDVNCYGASLWAARHLARIVHDELKAVVREVVTYDLDSPATASVLFHAFQVSSGYVALREPTTEWPRVIRTYVAVYDEREVSL